MRGEPEMEIRFQREMSLKSTAAEEGILLVNDYQHAEPREADLGRDGGVRRRQPEVDIVCGRGRSHLWFHRRAPESPTVSTVEQRSTRYCTSFSGQGERAEPGANDSLDCPLDEDSPGTEAPGATASLSTTLYSGGHRLAGRGGWSASGLIRPGGSPHLGARVPDLSEAGLRKA